MGRPGNTDLRDGASALDLAEDYANYGILRNFLEGTFREHLGNVQGTFREH
jgi:hypothetical protein